MIYHKNPIKKITFSVAPFCSEKHASQRVYVSVNNIQTLQLTFDKPDSIIITISDNMQETASDYLSKYISIKFLLPDAISPSRLGLNEDVRELGLALINMFVE